MKEKEEKEIGSFIRWLRKGRGYTLRDLAQRVGINHAHLSRIETNQVVPSVKILRKLAIALEAPQIFVVAGRTIPADLELEKNNQKFNDVLKVVQEGITKESLEGIDEEMAKYPSDDPFRDIIPDHPNVFPEKHDWFSAFTSLGIEYEWIFLPPPIRAEVINASLRWCDKNSELMFLEQEFKDKNQKLPDNIYNLSTVAEDTGFHKGFEMGLIEAFKIFQNQLKENSLWFFAFFFPPAEARLLTTFYELCKTIDASRITLDKDILYIFINAFINLLKDNQFNQNNQTKES